MTTDENGGPDRAGRLTDPSPTTGEHPGGPRRTEPPFPAVASIVTEYQGEDSSGHAMDHAWRVFRLAQHFAETVDADREVVGCAALTHDLHRGLGDGPGCHPDETLDLVADILDRVGIDEQTTAAVQDCVAIHDELGFRGDDPQPETVEAAILRDADNIDAMGAIGIARTFAFGGVHGTPLWDPTGREYSQLYHIEDKLLRLRDELHTPPARELAEARYEFLVDFREQFVAEWHADS